MRLMPLMPRALRYGLLAALAVGGVLLFLLASASSNTAFFERNYPLLLGINGVIAALLFVLVLALIRRLVKRLHAKQFGARMMMRFTIAFALMGVVPGVLIYIVSTQFLSRSIESWFDVRVDRALDSGLTLGRAALDNLKEDVSAKARSWALELSDVPESSQLSLLNRLREQGGIQDALLVSSSGQLIGASGSQLLELIPEVPSAAELRQARTRLIVATIEGEAGALEPRYGLRARVIVAIPAPGPVSSVATASSPQTAVLRDDAKGGQSATFGSMVAPNETRLLQLIQPVPSSIAANAEALQNGYREYQELSLARQGLQTIYGLTLTLTLLLSIFAAIASSVLLASSMTAPLLQVAEGTKAVAEGDYRQVREFPGNDELNLLTQSFNAMTRQLTEARDQVETKQREVENAKTYLERVLANLSAGVIVLNHDFHLVTANHGASRILGHLLMQQTDRPLAEIDAALASALGMAFADHALSASPKDSWQQQVEVKRAPVSAVSAVPSDRAAGGEPLMLLARGSRLPLDDGLGYVVVFDDITQIISAQRALAWGEVARRLAHEIKNPLTPIQLAAERLQMKLITKLSVLDADVLKRGTSTIVSQVTAMKRMVDDFRDYARVPPARLSPLALNTLVEEVAALYGVEVGTGAIELALRPGLPLIEGDATQLRQVIHNLLVNAQDALAGRKDARICVRTELVEIEEANTKARAVRLAVEDNGPGFPTNILRRAFEPYVTSKASGTGLGLAMVKKIVDEHGARIEVINRGSVGVGHGNGAVVTIVFRRLAEVSATPALHAA